MSFIEKLSEDVCYCILSSVKSQFFHLNIFFDSSLEFLSLSTLQRLQKRFSSVDKDSIKLL